MSKPEPGTAPRVLDVGQCSFDHRSISSRLSDRFGAVVDRVRGLDEARQALAKQRYALVLVNRLLDADGSSGVEVVRAIKSDENPALASIPVMLVSNHADAQEAALAAGAEPGFGKARLNSPETDAKLEPFLK